MPKQEPSHEGSSGLILRLADEVFRKRGTDEHCWRDIRTPGFIPLPYLPIRPAFPKKCIENSGVQGFVTRYRGGTVPESHGVPASPTALFMLTVRTGSGQRTDQVLPGLNLTGKAIINSFLQKNTKDTKKGKRR